MPIRKNILRKGTAPKQNLLGFDVLQEETGVLGDLSTSKFFKISEFPSVLPTGNSSFLIEGSDLLKPNVELKTEILDSQGNPIFHYGIPNYDKELPARRMTIEVYEDDVVNGIGSFTILAELDPRKVSIPTAFQDTYNVRFSAPININKSIKNTRPIRFYGDPTLSVSELVKGVIEGVYTSNQKTATITGSVSLNIPTPTTAQYGATDSTTADSTGINEVGNNQTAYISQNVGEAQSSILGNLVKSPKPYATYIVNAMEAGIDNADDKITSTMKGATFSITSPDGLVDSTVYPDADWTKPTTFSTKILDIVNSTTFTTTTQYKIKSKKNNQELIVPLQASASNVSITHNVGSVTNTASQIFQRSYANMTVGNLRTFSGDTYKAKVYMKEDGSSGEFEKIYETLVESPNELIDQNSDTGFKSVGIFPTQSIIDNFWVTSSATFAATQDDDTIIDGVILSGSTEPHANSFTFETSQSYSLEKNEPYLVDFDLAFKPTNKVQSDGTEKKDAKLEVFLTGTFLSETSQEVPLGEVELNEYDFNKINSFTKVKKKQITDFLTHNITGGVATGSLGFRVSSGEFILSDVRLRPFSETNFSPGFFKANVPMQRAIKRGQAYDFVVEFYDANNNLAEAVALADDVTFAGPRQVLGDGNDGVLTGSVFLSNTEDTGIEFHGGSAYIRSVGYNGFNRALDSGGSGFMMYSGSVSKSLNTSESYQGVGLELMDNSGANPSSSRFLKFRTNAEGEQSEFEVRTDNFLFGVKGITNNYISGSNGNLEISSSNFALQEDGDVIIEGTITAAVGGTIGGFDITTGSLAGADGHFFISGSASGSVGNFDKTNLFISSSGFVVNSQGDLIARSINSIILPAGADFSNTKFYTDHNAQSASVMAITGSLIVSSSQASSSLEFVKLTTGSLVISRDAVNSETASLQGNVTALGIATASLSGSVQSINSETASLQGNVTALGIATASLSGSVESINSETASLQGNVTALGIATASLSGSVEDINTTTGSLLAASESMQTQLVLTSTGMDLKNETGGVLSSFGLSTKLFGSASNATDYAEINPDGLIMVANSETASIFNAGGTTIQGGTATASLNAGGLALISAGVTGSLFSATGAEIYGAADKNERITISPVGVSLIANNVTGSFIDANGMEIYGASDKKERVLVNSTGVSILANDITGSSFTSATSSIFGSNDKHERIELVGEGMKVYQNNTQVGSFGSDITLTGGTLTIQGTAGTIGDDKITVGSAAIAAYAANAKVLDIVDAKINIGPAAVAGTAVTGNVRVEAGNVYIYGDATNTFSQMSSAGLEVTDDGTKIAVFAGTTTIGNTSGQHISIDANSIDIKTAANVTVLSASAAGISMSGSINAGDGTIGGFTINSTEISASGLVLKSGGQITGSSVQLTGEINASTGTTATSITAIGVITGSLILSSSNIQSQTTALGVATGSLFTSATALGVATASLSGAVEATNTVTGALLESSESMATQLVLTSTGMDLKNTSGGFHTSFGKSVKMFGSASNALQTASANVNYSEISPDGMIIVNSSTTSSFFGDDVRIYGGAISFFSGSVTASSFSSSAAGFTASIFGSADKEERVEVTDEGMKVFAGDAQVSSYGTNTVLTGGTITLRNSTNNNDKLVLSENSMVIFDNNNEVASFGANTVLEGGTVTIQNTTNNNDKVVLSENKLEIFDNNNVVAEFAANTVIEGGTITLRNTTNNNDKLVLSENSMVIFDNNNEVASFGANTVLEGGTVTIRNTTNNNDKVILSQNKLQVFDNNTDVASFGAITRIGAIANNHISMSSDGLSIKTAANVTVLSASADGITMSGSITAGAGSIGGWAISDSVLTSTVGTKIITLDTGNSLIKVLSGSAADADRHAVILNGAKGIIEVSQSGIGIFDTGRSETFTKNTIVEPAIFKPNLSARGDIVSSSVDVTRPVPTMDNLSVISSSKMNRLETQQFFQDTTAAGATLQDSLTPFFYMDRGTRMNPTSPNGAAPHQNPTASFVVATTHDMTGLEFTGSLFPPNFIFSSEYVTKPVETPGTFGFVSASASGSNIFTIMGKVSGSTHDDEDGDSDDFFDAKFNLLGLEANTRGLPTARQNEYTFFQAKHSGSIRAQLQHDGDFISAGNITAFGTSFLAVSDKRLKDDIQTISESLDRILELRPTGFKWKDSNKRDVGFIAQEVESIIPEIVETSRGFINTDNDQETKTIAYSKLTTYLVGAIQELTKRVEELEEKDK